MRIYIYMNMYDYVYVSYHVYKYIHIISLQVRRSSLTMSLAKDQVLRGPLVYLGLIELSPFFPRVHRRQVIFHICPPLRPHFIGIRATNDDRRLYPFTAEFDLNPNWLKLLTHDWKHHFFITFRSQPQRGLSNLQWKATKTDIPELLQSKFVAAPVKIWYDFA